MTGLHRRMVSFKYTRKINKYYKFYNYRLRLLYVVPLDKSYWSILVDIELYYLINIDKIVIKNILF